MSHGNARTNAGGGARRNHPESGGVGGSGGNPYDDASLARALQEEYEREYRRRSMRQHLGNDDDPVPARLYSSERGHTLPPPTNNGRSSSARGAGIAGSARVPSRPVPSAPPVFDEPFYAPAREGAPDLNFVLSGDSFGSVEVSDAAYARQLQREQEEEEAREIRKQHLQQQRDSFRATRSTSSTSATSSQSPAMIAMSRSNTASFSLQSNASTVNPPRTLQRDVGAAAPMERNSRNFPSHSTREQNLYPVVTGTNTGGYSDEEFARRLEQELRDEEVARQTFAEEQIRQSSLSAQAMYGNQGHNARGIRPIRQRGCCYNFRRCLSCCVTMALSAILAALLYVFVFGQESPEGWTFNPDQFRAEDPFNQANKDDANLWRTKGGVGLELIVINALDTNWHESFYMAVQQWDAGAPDALTLKIEEGTPESVCSPENDKLKVCNGNYGETNWRGINKVLLENGWIVSSAARMNEFYSSDNDIEQMQYTMCHEIGHGFGLPHTDENFFNKDLFNCMDYTNSPKNNMQPAEPNFIFLSQLYGTVDGSPVPTEESDSNATTAVTASVEDPQGATEDEGSWRDIFKSFGNRRRLLKQSKSLPPSVALALEEVDHLIDSGSLFSLDNPNNRDGWRRLHQSSYGESHEIDLGEGFTLRINLLR